MKSMKPTLIFFGISAASLVLRSILTAHVLAAAASRSEGIITPAFARGFFPELLGITLLAAVCGVIAACIQVWRTSSPLWVRAVQVFGFLLFTMIACICFTSHSLF